MIDIFKSGSDKVIIAIYPEDNLAVSVCGEVGLLIGQKDALDRLRIALNMLHDGWTKEEADKAAFRSVGKDKAEMQHDAAIPVKYPIIKITDDLRRKILRMHDANMLSRDIAANLKMREQQVRSVIGAHNRKKVRVASYTDEGRIDRIITDGVRTGKRYIDIADTINRVVGGHWLPDDVRKKIKELEG